MPVIGRIRGRMTKRGSGKRPLIFPILQASLDKAVTRYGLGQPWLKFGVVG